MERPPFRKLLVCNRGEIAIRIFRACTELGIRTVAIYSYEDRFSLHRYKADEAYQVGSEGNPVSSYLDIEEVIRVARESGAEAIHPGYGFLSENLELRKAADDAGIAFIGPSTETLEIAGDKVKTRTFAESVGVPVIPGSGTLSDVAAARAFADSCGYPVMVKAAFGGGGRGMRVVENESELENAYETAAAEAFAAFGKADLFIEKFIRSPKHIEVQLLGDGTGEVLHLFERDCSVQRRNQKVVEVAPAVSLDNETKQKLYGYGLALGTGLNLLAAATAEFLLDKDGNIFFIEINPRIQVEHTVTEEITGFNIVEHQIYTCAGKTFSDLGLKQEHIQAHGVAIQVRITTEDPLNNFQPDYGRLTTYRSASGFGIRLDAGSAHTGAEVLPFYDSLLVKVTARGRTINGASRRLRRCLSEFRIRGVKTNILFLENVLKQRTFLESECRTDFLETHPEVFTFPRRRDRATRLLNFLGEVTINGHELMPDLKRPEALASVSLPRINGEKNDVPPAGWRNKLQALGVPKFIEAVKEEKALLITDTTFRDAHQSLLATRLRSYDMLQVAPALARNVPQLFSLEMWGGATFDVALRFLREDPWERLALLREAVPNILFQMLIRGTNAVGYKSYPDNVIQGFIAEASASGIDIFRIFDCFNSLERMRVSIDATKEAGAVAEVCICYTGDVVAEEQAKAGGGLSKFDLSYYVERAKECEKAGADIIAIKDMAGLLRPYAAEMLVRELKQTVGCPIHFHTHDTAGVQSASYIKAAEVGVDIVDCAFSSMSGVTSQPALEGIVAALDHNERSTGMSLDALTPFSAYWDSTRRFYQPFESDLRAATGEVYLNEIPGGQYSNFRPQAASLGVGERWQELKAAYADVNKLFGGVIKVTPSSKVVGDLAIFMIANDLTIEKMLERAETLDFPASVVEFLQGEIGTPFGGFPETFQKAVLRKRETLDRQNADKLPPADFDEAKAVATEALGQDATMKDALSYLLYPVVFKDYAKARRDYGNFMKMPTLPFFYGMQEEEEIVVDLEAGKRLFIRLVAISDPQDNGERTVFYELNGQPRSIQVRDTRVAPEVAAREKADSANPMHIAASLAGVVVNVEVAPGSVVQADDTLFTIEAMKMQTAVRATTDGSVERVLASPGTRVSTGDLVVEMKSASTS